MRTLQTLRSVVRFRRFELASDTRRLAQVANIDDLRRLARRRLPGGVFDYIDGGAEDELTMRRNRTAFEQLEFVPQVLTDVSTVDVGTTLLGRPLAFPLVLAPTGFTRIAHPAGEMAVARAAARAGIPYTLSTMATRSIEEVAAAGAGDLWFQLYLWRDRGLLKELLSRASAAGYGALVVTVDTPVLGARERDLRRGLTLPPKVGLDTMMDGVLHPKWTWNFLRSEPISFANVAGRSGLDGTDAVSLGEYTASQFDPSHTWESIDWLRDEWGGPIVVKGIQSLEDARRAAHAGVEAIALSNHGGRQLDGAPPPVELVGPVAELVGDRAAVICDGGVRRGSDIAKALALGASACMAGRAYLYGLGAAGEAGVSHAIQDLRMGLARTMALCGRTTVADLAGSVRWRPS